MQTNRAAVALSSTLLILGLARLAGAEEGKPARVTYGGQVSAIFQNRCNGCHNADKKKGGLVLDHYAGAREGGASGEVIEPGDPDASRLYLLAAHEEEPAMPPGAPKMPDAELAALKTWIEQGAPETDGSPLAVATKSKLAFKVDAASIGKPQGQPAMPEGLSTDPVVVASRPNPITALAASPWAPLVAISGHKQVLLYHAETRRLVGVLPFPEGTVHDLNFSRDGALLVAGGGRGGQSGRVVGWDVKTGERLFVVGKEYDAVLSADISPDRGLVALGGPSKVLRVYDTGTGDLVYEQKKHTDWVTSVAFSPDGVLLASGDRNGGLLVWEAETGREFHDLRGHTAMVNDLAWRPDSNVLASAAEDGTLRLWGMLQGNPIKSVNAHPGGATSARFSKDGRIATTGRDRLVKLWDANGSERRKLEPFGDLGTRVDFDPEGSIVIGGDWTGEVRFWDAEDGKRLASFLANPAPLADRLDEAIKALAASRSEADAAAKELAALESVVAIRAARVREAQEALAKAEKAAADKADALKPLTARVDALKAEADALNAERKASEPRTTAESTASSRP